MSEEQVGAVILATLRALADDLGREAADEGDEEDRLFCEACAMEMMVRADRAAWVAGLAARVAGEL